MKDVQEETKQAVYNEVSSNMLIGAKTLQKTFMCPVKKSQPHIVNMNDFAKCQQCNQLYCSSCKSSYCLLCKSSLFTNNDQSTKIALSILKVRCHFCPPTAPVMDLGILGAHMSECHLPCPQKCNAKRYLAGELRSHLESECSRQFIICRNCDQRYHRQAASHVCPKDMAEAIQAFKMIGPMKSKLDALESKINGM